MNFFNDKDIDSNQTSEFETLKKKLTKSGSPLKNFLNTISIVPITQNVCCILEFFRTEPSLSDSNEEPD